MTERLTRTASSLRIFCAVLLLCLGFAHKPVYGASPSDPAGNGYLLPDGTFADLCIGNAIHGKPGKPGQSRFGTGCEACRLSAGMVLPASPSTHALIEHDVFDIDFPDRSAEPDRTFQRPGSPLRGPPSAFV